MLKCFLNLLASDRQLTDLSRFCCDPFESCVLTVDPTFCLGQFDVTPITYRHLLLESLRTGKPPVMIGPSLVHYKKSFQTYLFFASSLIGLKKELGNIRAFGTDGEKALIDAFSHEFRFTVHVICFIHVRKNIKEKLSQCSITEEVQTEILGDIFGKKVGSTLVEGLVDSEDDTFDSSVQLLMKKWQRHDFGAMDDFCDWLLKNKTDVIKKSMLRSVREEAGLGSPPEQFFTNASECVNSIIKVKVQYKSSELSQFVVKLRELCDEQEREIERAILRRGKYKQLEVNEGKWFSMSQDQRVKHIKKVGETLVSSVSNPEAIAFSSDITLTPSVGSDTQSISNALMPVASRVGLPTAAIEAISRKAAEILKTADGIVPAPGHGSNAVMVLSKSGKMPHLVTVKKNGGMVCDKDCPQYQSAGLCSHVVAAAKYRKEFEKFVESYTKVTRRPNVTKLVTANMPKGRGKKGGKAPAKRKPPLPIENRCKFSVPQHAYAEIPSLASATSTATVTLSPAIDISPSLHFMQSSYYPTYPPYSPSASAFGTHYPFRVHFVVGNISVCHGCKGHYRKELGPPHDLCIQHEEWRTFSGPGHSASPTPQSRFGNVYYHVNVACVCAVWPAFIPSTLVVPPTLQASLKTEHKELLYSQFGVFMQ